MICLDEAGLLIGRTHTWGYLRSSNMITSVHMSLLQTRFRPMLKDERRAWDVGSAPHQNVKQV